MPHEMLPYLLCLALLAVGLYGVTCKKNLVKIIIGLIIAEYAVNMFLVMTSYRVGGVAPIISKGMDTKAFAASSVDPIPQALILTSIVFRTFCE